MDLPQDLIRRSYTVFHKITGSLYHKFKEAKDLIAVGGGFSITDDSSFRTKMDELLTDPTALEHPYSIAISKESGHTITRIANPALSINGYGFAARSDPSLLHCFSYLIRILF